MNAHTPKERPTIASDRLVLRPFLLSDARTVQNLAGAVEIANMTLAVPHPYLDGMAETWINTHQASWEQGNAANFAIIEKASTTLVGAINLVISKTHFRAELGYWIGKAYWNNGFGTEAAKTVLEFGMNELALHKITSRHLEINPASGRILQKIGMQKEGILIDEYYKNGRFHNSIVYGLIHRNR